VFSVTATGAAPLTFQWQRWQPPQHYFTESGIWNDISGASDVDYSFIAPNDEDGTRFRVVVSNSYGSVPSNIALYLRAHVAPPQPAPAPITIHIQPTASKTVTEGSITGNLFVEASSPNGPLAYQWFSNTIKSNWDGTLIEGATSANFTIPTTLTASGSPYFFYCVMWCRGWETEPNNPFLFPQPPVRSRVAVVTVIKAGNDVGGSGSEGRNENEERNGSEGCNTIMPGGLFGMLIMLSALWISDLWSVKKKRTDK